MQKSIVIKKNIKKDEAVDDYAIILRFVFIHKGETL